MYNLSNLNDYEFEMLCKDIMEKKLTLELHRFGKGRDGGIDLCDSQEPMQHMIQVKHYIKSTYSTLRTSLKKEVLKVETQNPQNYYVCCSIELLPQQRREIFSLFSNYMKDKSFIIDKIDIDDFLSKEENKDILEKHYKLWLCSTNVLSMVQNQHIFIDCDEILNDIENYAKLFVTTKAYFECRNKLLDKNIIIIIGTPGVGKSTISKMLLLFFASKDYSVRYVTDNNIKDIKNVLSQDPAKKEIVLLDDFLGQHYLKVNDKQPNELKTLISFVERNPNKKIIMNSRITIINEAHSSSIDFANLIDKYEENNYLIDLDKMSALEKAEILYNHLYFNELPSDYFQNVKINKSYAKLIKHENYNPRIIEYVTKAKNYKDILPEKYIDYILSKLDNPDSVWEDEFRNRLQEVDRILMNTLYSLTNSKIDIDVLRKAFNKRILPIALNTTLNTFEEVINRLTNSLVKIVVDRAKRYISVINPSVNDYLKKKIENNDNEQIAIIKNAQYIEQIIKFQSNKDIVYEIIFNNEISLLNSIDKTPTYYYFRLMISYQLKDLKIKEYVQDSFKALCNDFSWSQEDLIIELIEEEYIKFYNLESIIVDKLENISNHLSYNNLIILLDWYKTVNGNLTNQDITVFQNSFKQAIQEYITDLINDNLQELVDNEINTLSLNMDITNGDTIEDLKELYIDEYYPIIKDSVELLIDSKLNEMFKKTPIDLDKNEIDFDYIFYNINIDDSIKSYVDNEAEEWKADYYKEDSDLYADSNDEWLIIDKIFS